MCHNQVIRRNWMMSCVRRERNAVKIGMNVEREDGNGKMKVNVGRKRNGNEKVKMKVKRK